MIFSIPETMVWPLLAALVLTGIHVYLGIHVIGRQVIFVDLAMAQIAGLGAAIGVLMGYELQHSPWGVFGYSLAFTLLAAFVFSITKMKSSDIPHEAIIGITYAVAVAVALIVLARSPIGPTEFDRMMKGELLYVSKAKVGITAAIYAAVGLIHVVFRKQFFALSFEEGKGLKYPRLWDFLFYATFGFVVTSSVSIAGVFLVFCLLVIPSVASFLFAKRTGVRLAIGWIGGGILCFVGIKLSYSTGWPPSPVIVVVFAAALVLSGIARFLLNAEEKGKAALKLAGFAAVIGLFFGGLFLFRHRQPDSFEEAIHLAHSENETDREKALVEFREKLARKSAWLPLVVEMLKDPKPSLRMKAMDLLIDIREASAYGKILELLHDPDGNVQEHCLDRLHDLGDAVIGGELLRVSRDAKPDIRVKILTVAVEQGNKDAIDELFAMMLDKSLPAKPRGKAGDAVASHVEGLPRPLNPDIVKKHPEDVEANAKWWKENRGRLEWRDHKFR